MLNIIQKFQQSPLKFSATIFYLSSKKKRREKKEEKGKRKTAKVVYLSIYIDIVKKLNSISFSLTGKGGERASDG